MPPKSSKTTPKGQPFNLELGKDFSIRVQMYVKNQEVTKERFDPVATNTEQLQPLTKIRRYETVAEHEHNIPLSAIDSTPDISFTSTSTSNKALINMPAGKFVQKEDIVRGYRYGSTIVTFDKAIQMMSDVPREGKQLQLIQFAKKDNILPQFLVSSPRYILPHSEGKETIAGRESDQKSFNLLSALVNAMLKKGVVALCRYAYNITSNPKLACLIPKITKKENYPILIHYLMPFRDDFRYFDFPSILSAEITDYQKDLIDEYINNMMLCDEDGNNELLKKRLIHDPSIEHQSIILRKKASNPGKPIELSYEDKRALLQMLEPPKNLLENAKHVITTMKGEFSLQIQNKKFQNNEEKDATSAEIESTEDDVDRLKPILNTLVEERKKLEKEGTSGNEVLE